MTMKMGRARGVGRPQRPYCSPMAVRALRDTRDVDRGQMSSSWSVGEEEGGIGLGFIAQCILPLPPHTPMHLRVPKVEDIHDAPVK